MLIRKACTRVTLAATFVLGTSLFAAEERFSFTAAGPKDTSINRAYAEFNTNGNHAVPERLNFSITRYATDPERDTLFSTASAGGANLADSVLRMPGAGYLNWPGGSSYPIRYARRVPRPDGGQDLVMIIDGRVRPWWLPGAVAASASSDPFSVIQVRMNGQGVGEGKVSFASAISANKDAGVALDYAKEPVAMADVRSDKGTNTASLY
jgi:hypothetical protein